MSTEKPYYQLNITNLPRSMEETVTAMLFDWGASGVQENLLFQQLDRHYQAEIQVTEFINLLAYFENQPDMKTVKSYFAAIPGVEFELLTQENKDWLSEWKRDWQPFELCPGVWVVPSWLKDDLRVPDNVELIHVDPGMAFGTGTHETTQLAAELMSQLLSSQSIPSFLDVGTGSGILTWLAQRHSIPRLYAYDNDMESKRVFHENAKLNQADHAVWSPEWSDLKPELTVANIIDGVLLDLKENFIKLKSRYYIFTGVLQEREHDFIAEMLSGWPLQLEKRQQKGEWVGFLLSDKA